MTSKEFEEKCDMDEAELLRGRANRIKAGGFKNEQDYFVNADPFTSYE